MRVETSWSSEDTARFPVVPVPMPGAPPANSGEFPELLRCQLASLQRVILAGHFEAVRGIAHKDSNTQDLAALASLAQAEGHGSRPGQVLAGLAAEPQSKAGMPRRSTVRTASTNQWTPSRTRPEHAAGGKSDSAVNMSVRAATTQVFPTWARGIGTAWADPGLDESRSQGSSPELQAVLPATLPAALPAALPTALPTAQTGNTVSTEHVLDELACASMQTNSQHARVQLAMKRATLKDKGNKGFPARSQTLTSLGSGGLGPSAEFVSEEDQEDTCMSGAMYTSDTKPVFELYDIWVEERKSHAGSSVLASKKNRGYLGFPGLFAFDGGDKGTKKSQPSTLDEEDDMWVENMDNEDRFNLDQPAIIETDHWIRHLLFHPSSFTRAVWDIMSLLLVAYDMVFLPMGFFDLPDNAVFEFAQWVTRVFWTMDIAMSFLSGYVRLDGTIEMRPSRLCRKYISTWFALDAVIILSDWFEIIGAGVGALRLLKGSRIFRIIRMVRLLRMAKMQQRIGGFIERIQSEKTEIMVDILKIVTVLLVVAHLMACSWWAIGVKERSDLSWPAVHGFQDTDLALQYSMSLHWSMSQFAGGMDEVVPTNAIERVFAISAFLVCFILAALFLSSLTSSMTRLEIISTRQQRQTQKLRRFLHQNGISGRTALRIQRNAQHAISEQQRLMPESDVELLSIVSEPLRYELHFEMFSGVFDSHVFFSRYKEEVPVVVRKICHYAMQMNLVSRGDVIFSAGEIPSEPRAYVFMKGWMRYIAITGDMESLSTEQWVAEVALWTRWMHKGVLTALADSRLYCLDANKLMDIVGQFKHIGFDPREYAKAFIRDLNEVPEEDLTDLNFHSSPGTKRSHTMEDMKPGTHVHELLCEKDARERFHRRRRALSRFFHQ